MTSPSSLSPSQAVNPSPEQLAQWNSIQEKVKTSLDKIFKTGSKARFGQRLALNLKTLTAAQAKGIDLEQAQTYARQELPAKVSTFSSKVSLDLKTQCLIIQIFMQAKGKALDDSQAQRSNNQLLIMHELTPLVFGKTYSNILSHFAVALDRLERNNYKKGLIDMYCSIFERCNDCALQFTDGFDDLSLEEKSQYDRFTQKTPVSSSSDRPTPGSLKPIDLIGLVIEQDPNLGSLSLNDCLIAFKQEAKKVSFQKNPQFQRLLQ